MLSGPGCRKTGTRMVLLVVCTSAAVAAVQRRGCWADPARLQARWCSVLRHLQGNTGTYVRLSFTKATEARPHFCPCTATATFLSVRGHCLAQPLATSRSSGSRSRSAVFPGASDFPWKIKLQQCGSACCGLTSSGCLSDDIYQKYSSGGTS